MRTRMKRRRKINNMLKKYAIKKNIPMLRWKMTLKFTNTLQMI
jgi:hypothetical protein